jgi:hypothetical protein
MLDNLWNVCHTRYIKKGQPLMPLYRVQVRVDFDYEIEADSEAAATEQGWNWEDYTAYSDVYSIDVEDITEEEDEEEDADEL